MSATLAPDPGSRARTNRGIGNMGTGGAAGAGGAIPARPAARENPPTTQADPCQRHRHGQGQAMQKFRLNLQFEDGSKLVIFGRPELGDIGAALVSSNERTMKRAAASVAETRDFAERLLAKLGERNPSE